MLRRWSMTRGFLGYMALGLCVSAITQAQAASGNGPYYATPSWDQKLPAATRFVVLTDWNNEAVLDRETGLVWEHTPSTLLRNHGAAHISCFEKTVGGRKGWRLPSLPELASLIDPTVPSPGPTLPSGHPFLNIQAFYYWSVTSRYLDVLPNGLPNWYVVNFEDGHVYQSSVGLPDRENVWCVRGGMQEAVY